MPYFVPQYITTTLNVGGGINASQTTGIILTSTSGIDTDKPGIICITYTDPLNTDNAEWITYTSIDGSNELQGVTRGAEGYSAKSHDNGATIAFPVSKSHVNKLATFVQTGWDEFDEMPTYASASTMTNPDGIDWTNFIEKGDSVSWNDGSDKLGYVTDVSGTTITIAGDSVANATITNFKYSKIPWKAGEVGVGSASHAQFTVSSATTTSGTYVRIPSSVTKDIKVKGGGVLFIMITCQANRSSGSYQLLPQIDDDLVGTSSSTSHPTFSNSSSQYVTTHRMITGYTGGTKTISLAGRIDGGHTLTISAFYSTQIVAFELF